MNKLFRSRTNSRLSGLCGGISEWLGIDATFVRLLVAITALFSFGTTILVYIIASVIVPKAPFGDVHFAKSSY